MPHPIDYTCSYSTTATLAAATATDVDIPIDGATDWSIVVKNTGATNAVTALTIAISHATLFEAAASVGEGVPDERKPDHDCGQHNQLRDHVEEAVEAEYCKWKSHRGSQIVEHCSPSTGQSLPTLAGADHFGRELEENLA